MKDSKVVTIDNAVPPLIGNILDYLIANLITRIWYDSPSNAIFILYRGLIVLEKNFLSSSVNWFLILTPRQSNRKGSDPTDKFRGYLHGKTSKGDSGMSYCVGYQRERKLLGNFLIKPLEFLKEIHSICPCEDVHHLWMCMEPSGVSGLLSHKPFCHFVYTLLGNQMWRWRQQFFRKTEKQRRLCFFF